MKPGKTTKEVLGRLRSGLGAGVVLVAMAGYTVGVAPNAMAASATPPTISSTVPSVLVVGDTPSAFSVTVGNNAPGSVDQANSRLDFSIAGPTGFTASDLNLVGETAPGSGTYYALPLTDVPPSTVSTYYGQKTGMDVPVGTNSASGFKIVLNAGSPTGQYAVTITLDTVDASGNVTATVPTTNAPPNPIPVTAVPPPAPAPTVTAISPTSGPAGTVVTVTGTGFDTTSGNTLVFFGTAPSSTVSCSSTTTCTASAPDGNGTVDVTVTTLHGTSAKSPADQFSYIAGSSRPAPDGKGYWLVASDGGIFSNSDD
ncbi:MAG: IPT/TIG domain-containing protein, partial [Acidimicrobiales bacterium]